MSGGMHGLQTRCVWGDQPRWRCRCREGVCRTALSANRVPIPSARQLPQAGLLQSATAIHLTSTTQLPSHPTVAAASLWNVKYGAVLPGALPGEVLVLGVGSLTYSGPHPDNVSIVSPQACSSQCANLPGCTAWNYCNRAAGCGSGCRAFTAANPKGRSTSGRSLHIAYP